MRAPLPGFVFILGAIAGFAALLQAQATWVPALPPPRTDHALAYDAVVGRVILFGGAAATGTRLSDMWEWDGTSWSPRRPATTPPARSGHAMVLDGARNRVVMFGGDNGARLADTWEWDGADWRQRQPVRSPAARRAHALTSDDARGRLVLFGGSGDTSLLEDTWEWDGADWNRLAAAVSPFAREASAMAYDPVRRRTILFGGATPSGAQVSDTWEWDGVNWSQLLPVTTPPRRSHHSMAWDSARGRVVMLSGRAFGGGALDDAWDWDGTNWSPQNGGAARRERHAMSYDQRRSRMVVFSGVDRVVLSDTLEALFGPLGFGWSRPVLVESPGARASHTLVNAGSGKLLLFGGAGNGEWGDTWVWNGHYWGGWYTSLRPLGRSFHAMAFDRVRGRAVLFGGRSSQSPGVRSDTWEWTGTAWQQSVGTGPPARMGHGLTYDEVLGRVLLFGGSDGLNELDDTWTWDGSSWLQLTPQTRPPARSSLALAYDTVRSRAVLFGGSSGGYVTGDTWEWDGADWLQRQPATIPPLRHHHVMAYDPRRQRIVMGFGDTGPMASAVAFADVWEWDGVNWRLIVTPGVSGAGRTSSAMAFDTWREQVLLFGGSGPGMLADTWAYGDIASYASYGTGCPGTRGVPVLAAAANSRPAPGAVLRVDVTNVPSGIAVVTMGFSDRQSGAFALPLALGAFGMPGCLLLADPAATRVVTGQGNSVSWTLPIPNVAGLASAVFFNQAFVLDPSANATGVTTSNGGRAQLGL